MNTALFIARRIGSGTRRERSISRLIRIIAVLSISLSLAAMILAMAVVTGFQEEIREKVIGFGGHIQVSNFDYFQTLGSSSINRNQPFLEKLSEIKGVRHIQAYATKAGILKTDDDIHGVAFKGVGADLDKTFFLKHLKEGMLPDFSAQERSDGIVVSGYVARRLQLSAKDDVLIYFIQDPPRIRRFNISAIYDTGLEELDRIFVIGDIRHVQRLNDWDDDQIGGYEVLVDQYSDLPELKRKILDLLPYDLDARTIAEEYPQIFDWLALLDMNVVVILVLMLIVASINMITTLLISILEKTSFIGIMKALGGGNIFIRKIFLYNAGLLIARGLLIGNLTGLLIGWLQNSFGFIKLPQESYYVSKVPVNFELLHILSINAGTFIICMLMLIIPSLIATRISPVKTINFR